jgi:Protein of unknown function (DUF3800)
MPCFVFLDESGEYRFDANSGKYLVFTGIVTTTPSLFTSECTALKYALLTEGHCQERFHACEDKQLVRNRVFDFIEASKEFSIHAIIVRKNRMNPALRKYGIYPLAYRTMLRYLSRGILADKFHFIVDTVPDMSQQTAMEKSLRATAEKVFEPTGVPFSIDHHSSRSHALLQVADYCAWAIHKKWQSGDVRSYDRIKSRIRNEFDMFASGLTSYY